MESIKFTTATKAYRKAGAIDTNPNVIGYHFINTGACLCYINDIPLYPSSVFDTVYYGMQDKSIYNIQFDTTTTPQPQTEVTVITFSK